MTRRILLVLLLTIASTVVATAQTAAVKDYYNQENKVGFKYPAAARWKVEKEESSYWSGSEEPGFTTLVVLQRNDAALPGDDIVEAAVSLKTATIDEATCTAMKIGNFAEPDTKVVAKKFGTRTFYYLWGSDGATGHSSWTQFYRTFNDGRCYELGLNTYGGNSGAKRARADKKMDQQFIAILRTLYFK
ncbi:MAG TPA: hypothetical protein VE961_25725 [Pyrinomonadaceae bacterium]|nr:hypothetical protein [Pyrinomonadaceae bacterium]